MLPTDKIFDLNKLVAKRTVWEKNGQKVVLTNGCFDLIHPGHILYLDNARKKGDKLIVAVNSDASVKRLKGTSRPINDEHFRCLVLAAFYFVDAVVLFDEDTPLDLIKAVRPDVLVKGGDWAVKDIVGGAEVKATGGEVLSIPFVDGFSSTSIIEKIQSSKS